MREALLQSPLSSHVLIPALHVPTGAFAPSSFIERNDWLLTAGTVDRNQNQSQKRNENVNLNDQNVELDYVVNPESAARAVDERFFHSFEGEVAEADAGFVSMFHEPAMQWVEGVAQELAVQSEVKHALIELPWLGLTLGQWLPVVRSAGGQARCVIVRHASDIEAVKGFHSVQKQWWASAEELAGIAQVWTERAMKACERWAEEVYVVVPEAQKGRGDMDGGRMENEKKNDKVGILLRKALASRMYVDGMADQRQVQPGLDSVLLGLLANGSGRRRSRLKWPELRQEKTSAYATILTANNLHYVFGAVVLGWSLALQDASRDRVALVTPEVGHYGVQLLEQNGWKVAKVNAVPELWFGTKRCRWRATNRNNQRVRWGRMASKLRLWELKNYSQVFYFDPDAVVTGQAWRLFENEALQADQFDLLGEGGTGHQYVNAGVLLLKPSQENSMGLNSHFIKYGPPGLFPNIVDCTEQALINDFFMRKHGRRPAQLSPETFSPGDKITLENTNVAVMSTHPTCTLCVARADVFRDYTKHIPLAVHFLRQDTCMKPWKLVGSVFGRQLPSILEASRKGDMESLERLYQARQFSKGRFEAHLAKVTSAINRQVCDMVPYRIWIELFHLSVFAMPEEGQPDT